MTTTGYDVREEIKDSWSVDARAKNFLARVIIKIEPTTNYPEFFGSTRRGARLDPSIVGQRYSLIKRGYIRFVEDDTYTEKELVRAYVQIMEGKEVFDKKLGVKRSLTLKFKDVESLMNHNRRIKYRS